MDNNFLELLKNGDKTAFEKLVSENQNYIYRLVFSMVHNEQDSQDIVQETFIKVYTSIDSFNAQSSISTWIYRIAYNLSIDFLKKYGKRNKMTKTLDDYDDIEMLSIESTAFIPEQMFESKEIVEDIHEALKQLPDEQRVPIELKDLNGLSYEEIQQIMNIPNGTLKSRLNRGRLTLRKILSNKWNI